MRKGLVFFDPYQGLNRVETEALLGIFIDSVATLRRPTVYMQIPTVSTRVTSSVSFSNYEIGRIN